MCGNLEAIEIVRGGSGEWRVIMFRVTLVTSNVGWGLVTCKESPSYNLSQ